jgi:fused signal recognition particle receptor
VPDSQSP